MVIFTFVHAQFHLTHMLCSENNLLKKNLQDIHFLEECLALRLAILLYKYVHIY